MKRYTITEQVFAKLGKERLLHEYSHCLYGLLGLIIDFITWEGETLKLSGGTNFNPYCQRIRDTPKGKLTCQNCDESHARLAARKHESVCYRCHAGLTDVLVPLYDHAGRYIGSMTAGQFHPLLLWGCHIFPGPPSLPRFTRLERAHSSLHWCRDGGGKYE